MLFISRSGSGLMEGPEEDEITRHHDVPLLIVIVAVQTSPEQLLGPVLQGIKIKMAFLLDHCTSNAS